MNRMRTYYVRDSKNCPVVTLVVGFDRPDELLAPLKITVGYAVLSNSDTCDKNLARKIALGRLNKRPITTTAASGHNRVIFRAALAAVERNVGMSRSHKKDVQWWLNYLAEPSNEDVLTVEG